MATAYILFAMYFSANGNEGFTQEFGSQGACEMAKSEGQRKQMFDRAFCTPKG